MPGMLDDQEAEHAAPHPTRPTGHRVVPHRPFRTAGGRPAGAAGAGRWGPLDLQVGPVAKRLGDSTVRMLGYNGSIPGPTLKVRQGSEIIVHVTNQRDLDTTRAWHGLRLENKSDGVPHEAQAPIPVGGEFTYRIQFPDAGLYWYHPHIREAYTQELGLYATTPATGPQPGPNSSSPWTTCCSKRAGSRRSARPRPVMRRWAASATSFSPAATRTCGWRPGRGRWCGCG